MKIWKKSEQSEIIENSGIAAKLEKLKKSAFTGLAASVVITLLWFLLFGRKSVKTLALAILGAAVILFLLKIIFDIVLEKFGITKKLLANELFLLFALIAFFSTTICAFAPVLLFPAVYDEKAENSLRAYEERGIVEELCLDTEGGTLYGWFLHNAQGSAPTVLYFGANEEDAAGRMLELLEKEQQFAAFRGVNVACIDYPDYGKSEGTVSEKSLKSMGLDVYDDLMNRSDVSRVILMGYGLGTGIANYVASERQPAGLILMAPYAEGCDLYNSYANMFHGPLKALVSFKLRAVKYAGKVTVKPLLLASNTDEVVPYESAVRLFERYKKGCNFVTIDNIGHDAFWETQEVLDEIEDYLIQIQEIE